MNPHQSGPRTVSRSHNKKPIRPLGTLRNPRPANSRKDDHIKTLTESKFRRVATCTGLDGGVCLELQLFAQFFLKVGNPFWGGFLEWNWRPCSFFVFGSLGGRWKDEILTTSRACKRESFFWYTCIVHDIAVLIHAPIFVSRKRGGDVWVKCRNNCSQGHVTLSLLDTIVLPRYVGSSCSSLKCANFAPWRNCT